MARWPGGSTGVTEALKTITCTYIYREYIEKSMAKGRDHSVFSYIPEYDETHGELTVISLFRNTINYSTVNIWMYLFAVQIYFDITRIPLFCSLFLLVPFRNYSLNVENYCQWCLTTSQLVYCSMGKFLVTLRFLNKIHTIMQLKLCNATN